MPRRQIVFGWGEGTKHQNPRCWARVNWLIRLSQLIGSNSKDPRCKEISSSEIQIPSFESPRAECAPSHWQGGAPWARLSPLRRGRNQNFGVWRQAKRAAALDGLRSSEIAAKAGVALRLPPYS